MTKWIILTGQRTSSPSTMTGDFIVKYFLCTPYLHHSLLQGMQGLLIYSISNFGKAISIGQEMTIFSKTGTRDFCLEDEILFIALFLQLWFIIFLAQKRYYSHLPVTHLKHTSFFQSCYVSLYKYIIIYLTSSKLIVI